MTASSLSTAPPWAGQALPVYCITLPRSVDRHSHMANMFETLDWRVRFMRAVDGREDLDLDLLIANRVVHPEPKGLNSRLSATEVACYLSHERAWRAIRREHCDAAVICEDDIRFRKPFLRLEDLAAAQPDDADITYLHYMNPQGNELTGPAFEMDVGTPYTRVGLYSVYRAWSCGGTQSYCITQRGAEKALSFARPIEYPVDGFLSRLSAAGVLITYALFPMPVLASDLSEASTILADR